MRRRLACIRFLAVLCLLLAACAETGWLKQAESGGWHATRMAEWEEAFRRADPRWRGADGAYSVPLSDSKNLWVFGDTWITAPGAIGREEARIIRNSLALQELGSDRPGKIEFFWRQKEDVPEAPFVPDTGPGWLWPLSGERVPDALCLFLGHFVANDSELGFELFGCWLFRVLNPDDPPATWQVRKDRVPFCEHGMKGDLIFGVGCFAYDGFLYVYGVREDWSRGAEGRSLLVARTPLASIREADFSSWRFLSGDGWASEVSRCTSLFDGAATEMSVSYLPGRKRFLAVYSFCGLSESILGRLARHPAGPWGEPMILFRCPEVAWSKEYFCYAGKAHPELAKGENEVVITYAVNSWKLEDHQTDLRLYWPRFVRLKQGEHE